MTQEYQLKGTDDKLKVCVEPFWFRKRSKDSIVYSDLRNIRYKVFFMNIKKVIQQKKNSMKNRAQRFKRDLVVCMRIVTM